MILNGILSKLRINDTITMIQNTKPYFIFDCSANISNLERSFQKYFLKCVIIKKIVKCSTKYLLLNKGNLQQSKACLFRRCLFGVEDKRYH